MGLEPRPAQAEVILGRIYDGQLSRLSGLPASLATARFRVRIVRDTGRRSIGMQRVILIKNNGLYFWNRNVLRVLDPLS